MKQIVKISFLSLSLAILLASRTSAQYFWDNDDWSDNSGYYIKYKYMDLFPATFTFGVKLDGNRWSKSADFIHFNYGLGFPSSDCWKAYLPEPDGGEEPESDGLVAMNIGMGWTHYFNHCVGFYIDIGWGPVMNLSSSGGGRNSMSMSGGSASGYGGGYSYGGGGNDGPTEETFITSVVPLEAGVNVNIFRDIILSGGFVYYFKEEPSLTLSVGYSW